MSVRPNRNCAEELASLVQRHHGYLTPAHVVEFARDPKTHLHDRFTWDDTEAAQNWRLHEAARIIRCAVVILDNPKMIRRVRAYVSLLPDRFNGRGYRPIKMVLSSGELRAQLLDTALAELQAFQLKYAYLQELSGVFAELEKVQARVASQPKAPARASARRQVPVGAR